MPLKSDTLSWLILSWLVLSWRKGSALRIPQAEYDTHIWNSLAVTHQVGITNVVHTKHPESGRYYFWRWDSFFASHFPSSFSGPFSESGILLVNRISKHHSESESETADSLWGSKASDSKAPSDWKQLVWAVYLEVEAKFKGINGATAIASWGSA